MTEVNLRKKADFADETHPGGGAETHPGETHAETHPGGEAETHPGGGAETHSSKSIRKSQLVWTRKTGLNRSLLF